MNGTTTPAATPRPSSTPPLVVDLVDSQPLARVGMAVALNHAPGFEPGDVKARPGELPEGNRPVVVGLVRGDVAEIEAVRQLADRGRSVLVLLPDDAWQAWAALRRHVAGGLSRHAPVARVMTALRAIVSGRSYWWLEPTEDGDGEAPSIPGRLSARERELLGLLAVGCSDQEIADQLVISVRTVWSHLERIRAKTGVRGRVELAMLAWHVEAGTLPERSSTLAPRTTTSPRIAPTSPAIAPRQRVTARTVGPQLASCGTSGAGATGARHGSVA